MSTAARTAHARCSLFAAGAGDENMLPPQLFKAFFKRLNSDEGGDGLADLDDGRVLLNDFFDSRQMTEKQKSR